LPLAGKPLIYWVWKNAVRMKVFDKLSIATDSEEIAEICSRFGACVELTGSEHSCGTERVAEVAEKKDYKKYGLVINIQGDLPLLGENCLEGMVNELRDKSFDIVTCGTKFKSESEWRDLSKVKMNVGSSGSVLGFSRKDVFGSKQKTPSLDNEAQYRHIGAYGCVREALIEWAVAPRGAKEREEGLEQLRAMNLGLTMGAVIVPSDAGAVDTFGDVSRIEEKLAKL
jgi:3-deoxy-manno-octulosonate cytidylyltransferase (CMP-KDO synthetase)